MGQYSAVTNISRVLFVILNCIFVALGAGIVGVGGWLLYLGEENDYSVITGSGIVSGASLLVVAGAVTLILSGLGIVGACGMWRPILFIYVSLIMIIVLLEVAAGIVGFVFRNEVTDEVEDRMYSALDDYRSAPDQVGYKEEVNDVVAYVQETFECCGVNSSLDWFERNPNVTDADGGKPPRECICEVDEDSHCAQYNFTYMPYPESGSERQAVYQAWDRGCLTLVQDNLDAIAISVGILGIIVGIVEFTAIFVAIALFVCIWKKNRDRVV